MSYTTAILRRAAPAAEVSALESDLEGKRELRLVAMCEGQLAGVASVANYGREVSTIYQLFVAAEARGRGIGSELVSEAERLAGEAGAGAVSAVVREDGPLAWWRKRGYEPAHIEGTSTLVSKRL